MRPPTVSETIILFFTLLFGVGCNTPTENAKESEEIEQSASQDSRKVSPKEQYVSDAQELVNAMIKISESIVDSESADDALSAMKKLKPKAEEMGRAAAKMIEAVRDDQDARNELVKYFQAECPSDRDLDPLIKKLGPERDSKYPKILEVAGELLETSMHNYF